MSKLALGWMGAIVAGAAMPVGAAILGPHAAACAGNHPAMLVRVEGLKARSGTVRVQSYGGNPQTFLEKGAYLERVEVQPPAKGPVEVCMPVPQPGIYAIAVRHQANGSTSSDLNDGGGLSGNPGRSLLDLAFKRKPSPEQISVKVTGVVTVPIVMNYVQGGSFRPVATAER